MKLLLTVCVLVVSAFAIDSESDRVLELAKILAQKGAITATDLARIEASTSRIEMLSELLRDRGVLSAQDYAKVMKDSTPSRASQPATPQRSAPSSPPPVTSASAAEVTSSFPLQLYGTLVVNAVYNTALTNNEDIPLFVGKQGSDPSGNDKNFAMTARQSRFGIRLRGPEVAGAKLNGQVEIDFLGGKAAFGNGVNMDLPRIRLAFGRLDWKSWSFEAGQDWSIFAPLNPTSFAGYAIPVFSASGNPWIRMPQFRGEYHGSITDHTTFLTQFAAVDPNMGDFPTAQFTSTRSPLIGERGRAPGIEARLSLSTQADDRQYSIGVSSHYARGQNFGLVNNAAIFRGVDSWGVALDYTLPLAKMFNLTGELFDGRALGIFSAASGEAILPVETPGEHGVLTRGGWTQGQLNFTPNWQLNLAYGLESPDVANLRAGDRSKNQSYMANVMYKLSKNVTFAWEYRRLLTNFKNQSFANNQGDHANVAVAYSF